MKDYTMNHIAHTLNARNSPSCERMLSSEDISSPTVAHCGSWRSKVIAKMKECRDAIKSIITPEKSPSTFGVVLSKRTDSNGQSHPFVSLISTNSMSPVPDIVASNSDAKMPGDQRVLIRSSTLNSGEMEKLGALAEEIDGNCNTDESFNRCWDATASDSMKSFLALEKQVTEEFLEENTTATSARSSKKKISAEPFLSYAQGGMEFVWSDDTEDSFSAKPWNSSVGLNSSGIGVGNPQTSSTFCDYSYRAKKCPSSTRKSAVQDSGFEITSRSEFS
ncbi:uncharacterized protein LOC143374334 [Andrena cerasifolii]|uniref:uncharacterized protein LOC143374334 n=1 Tax=Andrena cerasifolii TaxID=2819439 RepID=UPI00403770EC